MTPETPQLAFDAPAGATATRLLDAAIDATSAAVAQDRKAAEGDQEELFHRPAVPETAPDGWNRGLAVPEARADADRRTKAGRPPGRQNKSTRLLREWLLRGGVLPQRWMMDWLTIAPEELAARLKCSVADAWDRQAKLAEKLNPYFMAAMAATDDKGNAVPVFAFYSGGHRDGPGGSAPDAATPPWERERKRIDDLKRAIDEGRLIDAEPAK